MSYPSSACTIVPSERDTPPLAVFDLDDTLNRLREGIAASMARRGHVIPVDRMVTYDWHTLYGAAAPGLYEVLLQDRLLETAAPDDDAVDAVQDCLSAHWRVEVWTARLWHPRGYAITREWLDRVGLHRVAVGLVDRQADKAALARDRGLPDLFVDDNAAHVRAMARAGCGNSFLVERPWNRADRDVLHCPNAAHAVREVCAVAENA